MIAALRRLAFGRASGPVTLGISLVVIAQLAYLGALIHRSSFLVDDVRHYGLHDDAMITLTYARNLVEGHGLAWDRWGPPVEGYSHPLWLLLMIPAQVLPLHLRPLAVQVLAALLLVACTLGSARMAARASLGAARGTPVLAAFLTASSYALLEWSIMGMETALEALLLLLTVDAVTQPGRPAYRRAFVFSGLALLVRMDSALWVTLSMALALYRDRDAFPTRYRSWLLWSLAGFLPLAAWQVFRLSYYGDPLPNTYYLKLTGMPPILRYARGLRVAGEMLAPMAHGLGILSLLSFFALRRQRAYVLLLAVVAVVLAYYVYVGGDVYDGPGTGFSRFVVQIVPLLAVLAAVGLEELVRGMGPARSPFFASALATMIAVALCISFNHGADTRDRARFVRRRMALEAAPRGALGNLRKLLLARELEATYGRDLRVGVIEAGSFGYYSDFELVDLLGYSDREIARRRAHVDGNLPLSERFIPAHNKWDVELVVEERDVDVFVQMVAIGPEEHALLRERGYARVGLEHWVHERVTRREHGR